MGVIESVHGGYVHNRRVRVLRDALVQMIPRNTRVLDVGCGDGLLAALILEQRPDLEIEGIDVLVRDQTHVPVTAFDGESIPFANNSFDVVLFVDVLHHTEDAGILLKEAARVARQAVIIKDHLAENALDHRTLRFMDNVGNARYGVVLPYNYLSRQEWDREFKEAGLSIAEWRSQIPLYPPPACWIFGRGLHYVGKLAPTGKA